MISFFNTYGKNIVFSQNGEEGILLECLKRMKIETGHAVEIGGHNGRFCSNTALLLRDYGWSGKFVEADFDLWQQCCSNWQAHKDRVKSVCSMVGPENIDAFVDDTCVVCSIDVDGNDVAIFRAMTARPAIVIIEINSGFRPDVEHESMQQGSSYLTAAKAAIEKGYFVLCHSGNLILVDKKHKKLFPEIKGNGIDNVDLYFRTDWLKKTA